MKRGTKIRLKILGGIFLFPIFLVICFLLYVKLAPPIDLKSYADHWPADLSFQQADSIALDLVSQMSLDEKLAQMTGDVNKLEGAKLLVNFFVFKKIPIVYSGRNDRLHIPPFAFSDGPKGVVVTKATTFPVAIARAASWDVDLERRVGDAVGKEMRTAGANYFGGVCINLLRHPAWGRAQESYGEDPWLQGEMAAAVISGVQRHNVMACAKHYALNSIENSRFKVDVRVDERTLREVYLPHFKKAVDAGAASIMSAYNKVNGEYCGHNAHLLTDILRDDWGFQGFVSSDWFWGLRDGVKGVNAGMDVEMPFQRFYGDSLKPHIESGEAPLAKIDEMVRRIVRTKLLVITRTDPQDYPKSLLASEAHQRLALEAAEKSMVLLKNENETLPLRLDDLGTIAVIGELADVANIGDRGSSGTHPPHVITPLQGIRALAGDKATILFDDGRDAQTAAQRAKNADAVIYIVGYRTNDEGEYIPNQNEQPDSTGWGMSGDRPNLSLRPNEIQLLKTALPANPNSVVVLIGGSGIITSEWDELTPAILMAWYPGMGGGEAIAKALFGKINPSGKMPVSVPKNELDLPFFKADIDSIEYGYFHGYTWMDEQGIEPAYPFGFGLSYATFNVANLRLASNRLATDDTLWVYVDVTNSGDRAGEEVVQLYIGFDGSKVERPKKLLRDFAKVNLRFCQGQSRARRNQNGRAARCGGGSRLVQSAGKILAGGTHALPRACRPIIAGE